MDTQKLYRSIISVVEQPNGYYTVNVVERWEHGPSPEGCIYPNLSWAEVHDVVMANIEIISDSRTREFAKVLDARSSEPRLFDLPGM